MEINKIIQGNALEVLKTLIQYASNCRFKKLDTIVCRNNYVNSCHIPPQLKNQAQESIEHAIVNAQVVGSSYTVEAYVTKRCLPVT
jgi:hypothetical protein